MTQTTAESFIHIGDVTYEVGEPIPRTPENILALESVQQLVLARRVTNDGKLVTMKTTPEPLIKPAAPTDEMLQENPGLNAQYANDYMEYLRILKQQKEEPVPPSIGHVRTAPDNPAYFYLRQLDTDVISVLPYDEAGQPEHRLFRVHIAEIAE